MFRIDTKEKTIHVTRGDVVNFDFVATREGIPYIFEAGDVVRLNITQKKNCAKIVLSKDFHVQAEAEKVEIILDENETKFGEVINAPTDYWYEFVLNPLDNPQTILGYDEDGAKIFKLYPEGKDYDNVPEEAIEVVDRELSLDSDRPVANYVITGELMQIAVELKDIAEKITVKSIKPIESAAFEEMLLMGTWIPNTLYAILYDTANGMQANTGFYNGKYTSFTYLGGSQNVYYSEYESTGRVNIPDTAEDDKVIVTITHDGQPVPDVEVVSKKGTTVTDNNGMAVIFTQLGDDFVETSSDLHILARHEKDIADSFQRVKEDLSATNEELLVTTNYTSALNSKLSGVEENVNILDKKASQNELNIARIYDRTTCKTTKSGLGSVRIDDADDTDHDILIKAVPISEKYSGEQGSFGIWIFVPATGEEYQIGSPTSGEVITNPRSPFMADIRGPQQGYFNIEVTYNTSVSKGFDKLKEDVKKIEIDIDSSLDLVIAQQESIIAQQESILAIQNSLIGGESV